MILKYSARILKSDITVVKLTKGRGGRQSNEKPLDISPFSGKHTKKFPDLCILLHLCGYTCVLLPVPCKDLTLECFALSQARELTSLQGTLGAAIKQDATVAFGLHQTMG